MLHPIPGSGSEQPERARHDELRGLADAVRNNNDPQALRTFLATVVPRLLRAVRRVLGPNHPDLEDVTQEAALAVVQALPSFEGRGTVLHFSCRIAVLVALKVRRREQASKRFAERAEGDPDELATGTKDPEQHAMTASLTSVVRELLDTLSEPVAEALALHCALGYTVSEVSEAAGVPVETVRSRLRLGKLALRKRIVKDPALLHIVGGDS